MSKRITLKDNELVVTKDWYEDQHRLIDSLKGQVQSRDSGIKNITETNKNLVEKHRREVDQNDKYFQKIISEKDAQLDNLNHENNRLSGRLDAVLYALVIFKDMIASAQKTGKFFKFNNELNKWENLSDELKLAK